MDFLGLVSGPQKAYIHKLMKSHTTPWRQLQKVSQTQKVFHPNLLINLGLIRTKTNIIGLQIASCLGISNHIWLHGSEQTEDTSHLKY